MAVNGFRQLVKMLLGEYIKATPCLSSKLGHKLDDMQIETVEEGLMNFVYIVKSSGGSMVIKQALPYIRCIGESCPMSKERAKFEAKTLQIYASLSPCHVPQLYHFDPCLSVIAMQYLEPPHILLRKGLIAGTEYPLLAENISDFFAQVFFRSSLLYTCTTDHKRAVGDFCGNVEMINLMEQLAFGPYEESKHIRWTSPELDLDVKAIQEDNVLKLQVAQLKSMFCERAQALIHADFHAGSIMVTENSVKNYNIWLLGTLDETWNLFQQKFIKLWDEHKDGSREIEVPQLCYDTEYWKLLQRKYMEDVFQDALGFCATSLIGSVIHIGPVEDFETIENVSKRADCERNVFNFGVMLLKERKTFGSIGEVVSSLQQYMHRPLSIVRSRC